jgi:hypothetical protein
MGVVVGWDVPPPGSTVTPTCSPARTPVSASPVPDRKPAERVPAGPITQTAGRRQLALR